MRIVQNHLLRLDPEKAHNRFRQIATYIQSHPDLLKLVEMRYRLPDDLKRPVEVCGVIFPHIVGLAAGFDKQGEMLPFLQDLGFAHVEVGTVLPFFQQGNDLPRIWRKPEMRATVNRMGFNSTGASMVAFLLRRHWDQVKIPIGISPGKMKETPLERASDDYVRVIEELREFASYIAINVSSPNTPDLRKLQTRQFLSELVQRSVSVAQGKPVFVKFDPDSTDAETIEMVAAAVDGGASGVILTNTSTTLKVMANQLGGTSGAPLFNLTLSKVRLVRTNFPKLPIFGVGGIMNGDCAYMMLEAGATLLQLYDGFIYEGAQLIEDILRRVNR